LRVFVALEIPDEVRAAIRSLIGKLEKTCRGARWTRVEAMHVTLKFIGEAPAEKVERIRTELSAVRSPAPVEMRFRGTGFFPNDRHPRVFWAGIEASPNLPILASEIERRLEPLGIPREPRAFHPHLTLARFKSEDGLDRLRAALLDFGPTDFGGVRRGEFHLFQSMLKFTGAEYARLATFAFTTPAQGAP